MSTVTEPVSAIREVVYDRQEVGARLRSLRLARGLTQADLAWMSGITQAALSNYENGKRDIPVRSLIALSCVLDISPADLVPALESGCDRH